MEYTCFNKYKILINLFSTLKLNPYPLFPMPILYSTLSLSLILSLSLSLAQNEA